MITCRCLCGGTLTALRDSLKAKEWAVKAHNRTIEHRVWRAYHER